MVNREELKERILSEIARLRIAAEGASKDTFRELHSSAVEIEITRSQTWIQSKYKRYMQYFADGADIKPSRIQPKLVEVTEEWQADLFRLARLTWSLPFTKGYGRRLRFLLFDESNDKLIGVLGLQSPPLDFPARDRQFRYPEGRKTELVNQTMDIFTLGAVPPYGRLLGGKLVALAAASDEVRQAYRRKYQGRVTELDERKLTARIVALTTTSAFGRSSLYNRLRYDGRLVAQPIGFTEGYGSFHLAALYPDIREFLQGEQVSTKGGFGVGPRIVWQTYIRAFERLGIREELLRHNLRREVFLFPLVSNLKSYMAGSAERPSYYQHSFEQLAKHWQERWLLQRAERVDGWHAWDKQNLEAVLLRPKEQQGS